MILKLQFARLAYMKLFVNLEVSSFLNVSNLLRVSTASSKESKRTLWILGLCQWCFETGDFQTDLGDTLNQFGGH